MTNNIRLIDISEPIQKRMEQEAEWVVRGYFLSSVWDLLTEEQRKRAIQPVLTAMRQVIVTCAQTKNFVTYRELKDKSNDN